MRLMIAKSTFDHPEDDSLVSPGQPLRLNDSLAAALEKNLLVESPRPEMHFNIEEGPKTAEGLSTRLFHKGGGSYLITDDIGEILNDDPLKGREAAEEFAREYERD